MDAALQVQGGMGMAVRAQDSASWATWHSLGDAELRSTIIRQVYSLFAKRKPVMQDQGKLPDFIKRLEEALYKTAKSREEYADLSTLEPRLLEVVRRVMHKPNGHKPSNADQLLAALNQQASMPQDTFAGGQQGMQLLTPLQQGMPATQQQQPQQGGVFHQQASAAAMQASSQAYMLGMLPVGSNNTFQPQAMLGHNGGMVPMVPEQQQAQLASSAPILMTSMIPTASQPAAHSSQTGASSVDNLQRPQSGMDTVGTPSAAQAASAGPAASAPAGQLSYPGVMLGTCGVGGSAMMSNGAPVLLRGGGGAAGMCSLPMPPSSLNGMVPNQATGTVHINTLLGGQQPILIKQEGSSMAPAGMVPTGGMIPNAGMVPMSATGAGPGSESAAAAAAANGALGQQQDLLSSLGLHGLPGGGTMVVPFPTDQHGQVSAAASLLSQPHQQQQPFAHAALRQQHFPQQLAAPQQQQQQRHGSQMSLDFGAFADVGIKTEPGGAEGGSEAPAASLDALLAGTGDGSQAGNSGMEGTSALHPLQHEQRKQQILKQQRWLLFLRHCAKCPTSAAGDGDGQCQYGQTCSVAKELWKHLINCKDPQCSYPRCAPSRLLLRHHQKCTSAQCPVCTPVKQYVLKQRAIMASRRAAALPPEQRQQYLLRIQQSSTNHPELLKFMEGVKVEPDTVPGVHPSLAAVLGSSGPGAGAPQQAPKRARTLLQENMGTSLLEYFNQQQIRLHLQKLKAAPQPVAKSNKLFSLDELPNFEDENSCKVCGLNRLTFEPPSLYCFCCGQRIKRNQVFHCTPVGHEIKGNWCHTCFTDIKNDKVELDGFTVRKHDLEKRKNDDEVEEGWVQCDRCQCWVHQICGLFNKGRNDQDRGYLCPHCLLHGLSSGDRRLPEERPQAMLSAKDLPRCELSDHLEKRLERLLQDERRQRAAAQGVPVEQVPTVEGLTVRVVNNVEKKNEVKMRFYDAFKGDGYPEAFLYKQKVILLFQNVDGVDLCLYCLYMQEYGEDAAPPNRKMLYLSYLDSVKYFQPEDVQAAGRNFALRTLVYHDVLVGYLQFMKQRGFLAMYIWACPPLQGDDYILYCHPFKQKTPRSDRLREWYHTMLRQAKAEGIVTYVSNLFDTYFEGGRDHRLEKPSITHVPYFEGDYWPGEAENLLANLGEEQRQAGKNSKGTLKGGRKGGNKGKRFGAGAGGTDEQLLQRLGDVIQGMKEDFMVVHLREPCSYCREYISGGPCHLHPNPPQKVVIKAERSFDGIALDRPGGDASRTVAIHKFQLCGSCLQRESGGAPAPTKPRGLPSGIELRDLVPKPCDIIPSTHDPLPQMENEFFDSRQAFLSLCQGNHYQFDTLRRAKHSSMMVLYHLHNPTAPAFSCTCNVCHVEIEPGSGYRCTVCSDFDMCARCKAQGAVVHPHPLTRDVRKIDEQHQRLTEKERKERTRHLHRTMQLLVHASGCSDPHCTSSNCAKVKGLFNHAMTCKVKIAGGCPLCRRMWALLQAHAKMCTASECPVPRCRELRELRRVQAARQDEKRRAAYRAMLRAQQGGGAPWGLRSRQGADVSIDASPLLPLCPTHSTGVGRCCPGVAQYPTLWGRGGG